MLERVPVFSEDLLKEQILGRDCCRRAFIRGAFLAAGSMSDPGKSYHLEIVCRQPHQAQLLQEVIEEYDLPAKIARRKNRYIVYMKDSERIFDLLESDGSLPGLHGAGKRADHKGNAQRGQQTVQL